MTKIINLESERNRRAVRAEDQTPHLSGPAICLDCRREWIAVAPVGTTWLQCPSCGLEKGRLRGALYEQGTHWHCDCGNELFACSQRHGWYCVSCGAAQRGWEEW